jgi:hypothetical protein
MGWWNGSSGRMPALRAQGPEYKCQNHQENKQQKTPTDQSSWSCNTKRKISKLRERSFSPLLKFSKKAGNFNPFCRKENTEGGGTLASLLPLYFPLQMSD